MGGKYIDSKCVREKMGILSFEYNNKQKCSKEE